MRPPGAALKPVCEIFHKLGPAGWRLASGGGSDILPVMAVLEKEQIPELQNGDVLSRAEFERRYAAMPHLKKAELIDGIVYIAPPVRADQHGFPHVDLAVLLRMYALKHPGLRVADNSTVKIDNLNQPQPDLFLMREGGQSKLNDEGYLDGVPELVAEIAASSAAYDLHQKKRLYFRTSVLEYLVWITGEKRFILFAIREGEFVEVAPSPEGFLESPNFEGLVIDTVALNAGDLATALSRLA
jgi:Uma2 family endonuclease